MIVCKKCGFNNTDADTFCGSCGAFLEWTGEKVSPPATPEAAYVAPETPEPARRGGFMALVQQVTAIGVPKKEAIDPPATIPGMPMPAPGPRPAMPGAPAPFGAPAPLGSPRPIGPMGPSPAPLGAPRSLPPGSPPPLGPPRSAPPSGPPSSLPPAGPPLSAPPSGPPRSAPPAGPPIGAVPTSAPPMGPPLSAPPSGPPTSAPPAGPPRSAPPAGPPPGAGPPTAFSGGAPSLPPAPVAPSLPRPSLPPPTLPAPSPVAPTVIRVTPEGRPATPMAPVSPLQAPAGIAPGAPSVPTQPAAQPVAVQPAAIQPAVLAPRTPPRPAAAPPSKRLKPGDLICGQCGEGNEPVRKFCSRCGQSLATAAVASTPWWRRIIPHRKAKVLAAGERPGGKGARGGFHLGGLVRIIGYVVVAAILLGGLAYGAVPGFRDKINNWVTSVEQNFSGTVAAPTPVHATSVTASSAIAGHAGSLAVDAFSNTYWAASLTSDPHPVLTVGFSPKTNINVMLFISGNTANELSEARPKVLHIVFSNGASQNITLVDNGNSQQFQINGASGVTSATIQITSVYPSTSSTTVALSDVEFFGRQ
jgi:hypothetical protein